MVNRINEEKINMQKKMPLKQQDMSSDLAFKMLLVQLKSQNPNNPMNSNEMIAFMHRNMQIKFLSDQNTYLADQNKCLSSILQKIEDLTPIKTDKEE